MMVHFLNRVLRRWAMCCVWCSFFLASGAMAHSSSNSYLTLSAPENQLTLRADIHLRDIDLIFDLDNDHDGQITWGEVHARSSELSIWLGQGIQIDASGQGCTLGAADLRASLHADGTYLSAQWVAHCPGLTSVNSANLTLRYGLMFAQDNLHRGLLKVDFPAYQSSALLSPERPVAQVTQVESSTLRVFARYLIEGVWHIWIGVDHILFLLSLLVLAPLIPSRQRVTHWKAATHARPLVFDVMAVVTAFTVAHSITLGLSVTKWLEPSVDLIEPAIALSVVLAALNNLLGWSALKRWRLAFVFGLVHGFGFANVLLDLGLPASALVAALGGFNVGVELGQLAIVMAFLPVAWLLRNTLFYRWVVVTGGSLIIIIMGLIWTFERIGWLKL